MASTACGGGGGGAGFAPPAGGGTTTGGSSTAAPGATSTPIPNATAAASATPAAGSASPTPVAGSTSPTPAAAASSAAVIPGFVMPLQHNGRWLTDGDGRVVIFHGINVAYKSAPYTPQAQGFTQADAAMLAREGFSCVRLWIWWSAIEPSPGVWDDSSLAATKQFIGWLNAYGITVRLNFAQVIYSQMFGGIGFPDWAANDEGLPLVNLGSDIYDGVGSPSLHAAFDNFWANEAFPDSMGLQDHFARVWTHVVTYFKGTPGIVAYDVVNEPEGGSQTPVCVTPPGCPEFDLLDLTPFYEKIVAAIRTVDSTTMIDYEPEVLAAVGVEQTHVAAGTDKNLNLTFHYYPQTDEALTTTAPVAFQNFETDATTNGDSVLLSEFGATDDLTQVTDIINTADSDLMGWLYWAFYSTEPTGNPATPTTETINPQEGIVYDPTQPPTESNLKTAKLEVLDRPYPFLISGTPTAWAFNTTTNTFTMTYTNTPVAGGTASSDPTVIVVPVRLFPNGYTATVTGGVVTSVPNAMSLTIQAPIPTTTISVTVAPAATSSSHRRVR